MKEGIVATIIDDIKSEVEYKNNLPYDGILKSKNHETIYKNGFLVSSTYVRDYNPEQILEKKEYEKGKIAKVISSQFNISVNLEKDQYDYLAFDKNNAEEDQFQGFVGFYKNEKLIKKRYEIYLKYQQKSDFSDFGIYKNFFFLVGDISDSFWKEVGKIIKSGNEKPDYVVTRLARAAVEGEIADVTVGINGDVMFIFIL